MKKCVMMMWFCVLSFAFLIPLCPRARAQAEVLDVTAPESIVDYDFPGLKKEISLDIRAMDVSHFLKFLAIEGDLNIVASTNVAGPVNLLINNVSIGDALSIVLSMSNFAYEVQKNVIKIMTNDEYKLKHGVDFYDQRLTVIYQLEFASVKNVGTLLGNVKSEIGKIIYDESTGTLVLIDTPAKIKEMEEIIKKEELPTITRILPTITKVFELKYAKVEDVKSEIIEALTPDIGTLRSDTKTNTLVITDLPHQMKKIETLINAFDRKTRQVFIEAKIVEVTLSDTFQWGIDWNVVLGWAYKVGDATTKFLITPEIALPLALTGDYGKVTIDKITGKQLNAVLEFLDTVTDTRIISSPHITVEEGKEATIEVIEKQPYEEDTTVTAEGGTTTQSKTYQWVDVGVTLNVTPYINEDGFISMLIKPEVSSISTWYGGEAQAEGSVPVVKSANAETTVTIKDGVSIIIAGLIKEQKTQTINKIPFLGDIPVFGKAFQNVSDDVRRTETVIFLTPRIVGGEKSFSFRKDMVKPMKGMR